ncbi:MAG TPA: hypothetical protein VF449_05125 [Parvibaculum sp.]
MTTILRRMVFLLVLCAPLSACGPGSDDTLRSFYQDMAEGHTAAAVQRFSPDLHKQFGEEALQAAVEHWTRDIKAHGGLADVALHGGVVTYNELALYDVTLTYADGSSKSLQTSLVHVDGDWYINAAL